MAKKGRILVKKSPYVKDRTIIEVQVWDGFFQKWKTLKLGSIQTKGKKKALDKLLAEKKYKGFVVVDNED